MRPLLQKALNLIQYSSDLHLERNFSRIIVPKRPNLVLNGDIGYPNHPSYREFLLNMSDQFDKVFITPGNHEYDNRDYFGLVDIEIKNICETRNNLFYLNETKFTLCEKDKLEIIGCTLFSPLPKSKINLHFKQKAFLENSLKSNNDSNYIVVTHHCPLKEAFNPFFTPTKKQNDYFLCDFSEIIKEKTNTIPLWIYGHTHYNNTFLYKNTLFTTNQYGYKESPLHGYWF